MSLELSDHAVYRFKQRFGGSRWAAVGNLYNLTRRMQPTGDPCLYRSTYQGQALELVVKENTVVTVYPVPQKGST